MKNYIYLLGLFSLLALGTFSCNDDDEPTIDNEEELITTLNYTLVGATGNTVTMSWQDLDGDGGNAPTITGGTLNANETYVASIELLNESESPTENITVEVREEDDEHQFFFSTTVNGLSVGYADTDGDGNPVGITNTVTTGDAASGTLTITLRHEPDKSADGVSEGDITNAGGETDIAVTFNVDVQ